MHRENKQQENPVYSKLRHDIRSRFSLLIGVLEIMSEDEAWEAQRNSILNEKLSVESCLEEILRELQLQSSNSPESLELIAFDIVRTTALPCFERLTSLANSRSILAAEKNDWAETLLQEVSSISLWCEAVPQPPNTTPQQLSNIEPPNPNDPITADKRRLIVIDDEPHNIEVVRMFLKKENWQVIPFTSGEQAIQALQSTQCDLILLDLNLNGLSGFKTLESLKNVPTTRHIPVIMVTGSEDMDALEACLQAGAASILSKPFSKNQLLEILKSKLT